jgi:peptide/nickel transport system permease protein
MRRFLLRRLGLLVLVVLGIVTIVFLIIHLIPGDPIEVMLGETALPADREALRHALGLDRPVFEQYGRYLYGLLQGDLGNSIHTRRPVAALLAERIPATLELTFASLLIALAISIPAGVLAAARARSWFDHSSMLGALLGVSIPNFWLGPMLIVLFSLQLGWLPASGRGGISHLILPAVTLGTALAAILTRMTRASLLEVLPKDFVQTARAKGLREVWVLMRHALRNALIPIITLTGLQCGALLSGAIITETIFAWPGIGRLILQAIATRDYPLVQGCVLVFALGYVGVNLVADLLYAWSDPRVRYN